MCSATPGGTLLARQTLVQSAFDPSGRLSESTLCIYIWSVCFFVFFPPHFVCLSALYTVTLLAFLADSSLLQHSLRAWLIYKCGSVLLCRGVL